MKEEYQITVNNKTYVAKQMPYFKEEMVRFAVYSEDKVLCHIYLSKLNEEETHHDELSLILEEYLLNVTQ